MDRREWLSCTDLQQMLESLRGKASDRKLRLFFCACCRGKRYTVSPQGQAAVAVAEAVADGQADETMRADAERVIQSLIPDDGPWSAYSLIALALHRPIGGSYPLDYVMMWAIPCVIEAGLASSEEVASILVDLFGLPPCCPVTISPAVLAWNKGLIKRLAESAYENRLLPSGQLDADRLAVLSDALEEAGADAEQVEHLRGPGQHWRGCFVVDALTGRE